MSNEFECAKLDLADALGLDYVLELGYALESAFGSGYIAPPQHFQNR